MNPIATSSTPDGGRSTPFPGARSALVLLLLINLFNFSLVISEVGCSRSPIHGAGESPVATERQVLSVDKAAQLAAKLANEQCERQYRKRPFAAEQHSVRLENGLYHWGGLDVGAPGGFSALVTFHRDGSGPHVQVYFSSDIQRPKPMTTEPPEPRRP